MASEMLNKLKCLRFRGSSVIIYIWFEMVIFSDLFYYNRMETVIWVLD